MKSLVKFYTFLHDRDARIVELFFLGLNTYILALIILPPYTYFGWPLYSRAIFQSIVVLLNILALIQRIKRARVISSVANASIMIFVAASLFRNSNPNAGTYALLALLAIFVTWKINIK